jgi:transposase
LKSIHAVPVRRNDEITIAKRAEYCNEFMRLLSSVGAEQFFFADEVGFSVNMRSTRGRSLRGTSAVHVIPALRTRNISVCCAMNTRGILHYSTKTSAYNTQTFCDFLRELLAKLTQKRIERGVIVLDNVPFHHSTDAKRVFEGTDHTMIYLPPYSPFLNPIENMFSKWKEGVKKSRPQNEDELMRLITEGSTLITEDNCQSFFRGMIGYIHRGILGDSIFD